MKTIQALQLELPTSNPKRTSGLNCMNVCAKHCRGRFRRWLIGSAGASLLLAFGVAVSLFHDARLLARRRSLPVGSSDDDSELWLTPYRIDVIFDPSAWECAANTLLCVALLGWFGYGTWLAFACPICGMCPSGIGIRVYVVSTWLGGILCWIGLVVTWLFAPRSPAGTGADAKSAIHLPRA
jgi:hypothetical protein